MELNTNQTKEEEIAQRQLDLMKKGFKLGKLTFDREELYFR